MSGACGVKVFRAALWFGRFRERCFGGEGFVSGALVSEGFVSGAFWWRRFRERCFGGEGFVSGVSVSEGVVSGAFVSEGIASGASVEKVS